MKPENKKRSSINQTFCSGIENISNIILVIRITIKIYTSLKINNYYKILRFHQAFQPDYCKNLCKIWVCEFSIAGYNGVWIVADIN